MRRAALATACISLLACIAILFGACSQTPPAAEVTAAGDVERGRLLYETACVECHSTQAHWRDRSIVRSWPDLLAQVVRWQAIAGRSWSESEIRDVAGYLNQRFYKLPAPQKS